MSQENVDLHRRATDAVNRRDLDALLALAHEDIESASRLVVMEGSYHGHEGVRRWWRDFFGFAPDYSIEVLEIRDLGDVTLAHMRGSGSGSASATPFDDPYWQVCRWRDAKCVFWSNYPTEAEALKAIAGLGES
jgi:ketosteroid isomerase-like protein